MKSLTYALSLCAGLLAMLAFPSWAFEPFEVSDIRVEGLQRISAGTVFNYLPVKVGETLDRAQAAEAVRALFKTGFFRDVRLEREGDVLIVWVTERPALSEIEISGNREFKTDQLLEALKEIGFAKGRVFDRSLLDKVEQELERQYFSRGKYGVRITSTVTPLERNRVSVAIEVSEGRVAKIQEINIVGNTVFSDKKLKKQFQLSPPTWLSFYTKNDQYSKQKLAGDLEKLRSYYLDRGYINFSIGSTQVTITPDKQHIYITINLKEGEQYTIKEVKLAGDLVLDKEEFFKLVELSPGSVFSRKAVTKTASQIGNRLGDEGYAFANVNAIPDIDKESREVVLTFFIDPGRRVYVRRIIMSGNTKTADEVLRREMRQMEGAWISTRQVERSRTRLERLGFFKSVNVETPAVPGTTDQVDVKFTVEEKPSGNLLAAVGFGQTEGLILSASINQENFLGTGRRMSLNVNTSDVNRVISVGYTNPYYTLDGVSRGFNLFYRETDAESANLSDYSTDVLGGDVSFGIPINEYDFARISLGATHTTLEAQSDSPIHVSEFIEDNGDKYTDFLLTGSVAHDTRNRAIFPDRGVLQRLSAEASVPGSDLKYYKIRYRHEWLRPLTETFILALNGELGYGDGYSDTSDLPFFENFFAGGASGVRGFKDNTLGPKASDGDPLGGNKKLVGSAELVFPTPLIKSEQVRLSAFLDLGNVFAPGEQITLSDLRYSTGLSMTWLSPLGPLKFSLAQALNAKAEDNTQSFHFSVGTLF